MMVSGLIKTSSKYSTSIPVITTLEITSAIMQKGRIDGEVKYSNGSTAFDAEKAFLVKL